MINVGEFYKFKYTDELSYVYSSGKHSTITITFQNGGFSFFRDSFRDLEEYHASNIATLWLDGIEAKSKLIDLIFTNEETRDYAGIYSAGFLKA
jgi:hypothetical protein